MMVDLTKRLEPSGPRLYDLNCGGLKALHKWGDEWWIFRRTAGGAWVSDRPLTVEEAVKIVIAAEKKFLPGHVHQLEQAFQEFVGELISTFAEDARKWRLCGALDFAQECLANSKAVQQLAIERGLVEAGELKPPDSKSGEQRRPS